MEGAGGGGREGGKVMKLLGVRKEKGEEKRERGTGMGKGEGEGERGNEDSLKSR